MKKYIILGLVMFAPVAINGQKSNLRNTNIRQSYIETPFFDATPYQREILLSWEKPDSSGYEWEIVCNDKVITTQNNTYLLTGLDIGKRYDIKIRAKKGNAYSEYEETSIYTNQMEYPVDSENRIPYLRTLSKDGFLNTKEIDLYFNDLATLDAKISYFVDGVPITPNTNKIILPKTGKQVLKLIIEETPQRIWEIEYNLDVMVY